MECLVYKCIENTGMHTCAKCGDFPCEYLRPYRDQTEKWHNTKVYHLYRIKKSGLEKWAQDEAGDILDIFLRHLEAVNHRLNFARTFSRNRFTGIWGKSINR